MIIRSELEQFYVYMITGMVPWLFFDMALRQGSCCVRYQGELVKKIYFPREVLPLACVTSNCINMLFCFLIVFLVLMISSVGARLEALLWLPLVMGIEYLLTLGFTLLDCLSEGFRAYCFGNLDGVDLSHTDYVSCQHDSRNNFMDFSIESDDRSHRGISCGFVLENIT